MTDHIFFFMKCQANPFSRGCLLSEDHHLLDSILSPKKIRRTIFFFKSDKVAGPYGLHPFVYQKYWQILEPSVIKFCEETLSKGIIEPKVNSNYLCLIPKYLNTSTLKNFRFIGLCNTQYKLITKSIARRLRSYLTRIISTS